MRYYLFIVLIVLVFNGCIVNGIPKMEDYANGWIGTNIDFYIEAGKYPSGSSYVRKWKKDKINKDYYLKNGNLIHVYPEREGCIIHWEVDKNTNKIINYKFSGDKCY